jgi:hypothetical protein
MEEINMNATTQGNNISFDKRIMVDITGLMELLSCGRATALNVAEEAEAIMKYGKRTLFSVEKVREYVYREAV